MQDPFRNKNEKPRGIAARMDRAAADVNAVLLVLAIGLAALDFSCFFAFKLRDALPPPAAAANAVAATPYAGLGGGFAAAEAAQAASAHQARAHSH